jgi:hypothetical protein
MRNRRFGPWHIKRFAMASAVAFIAVISGCSAPQPIADAGNGRLSMPVRIVDMNDNVLPVSGLLYGTASFGAIPGSIYGNPQSPRVTMNVDTDAGLIMDFSQFKDMSEQATTITPFAVKSGWNMVPADTRFTRVGTSVDFVGASHRPSRIGFADSNSKDTLLLVFFDRPCHLTGTIIIPPQKGEASKNVFEVTIKKAGFNWLSMSPTDANDSRVIRQAPASARPVFVVKY